jgi:two-component SAPR family response regulator
MNCLIVYDEYSALDLLEQNIKKIPFLKIEATCIDVAEAMDLVSKHTIDLIFLDFQLPGTNTLCLLRALKYLPPVILISAYPEHAVDGFDLDVVDYLLEPVIFPRFLKSVQKVRQLLKITSLANKALHAEAEYVFVNANYSLVKVMLHEIIY